MKKVLALVLALTMVFGTMSFALAAPADVEGTDFEDAVVRLNGLKILVGYPDGSFKPDNNITRAEFAAVAVRLLGLEAAAQYATGATNFNDVAGDHWGSGYVNIAVNRGIIVGYPDGTFKPENNVTYSEAITMLVRVLGYGPATDDQGTWPANYIAKAAELDITDGVNFAGSTPATRGNVAVMSDNSLEVPLMVRVGYGDEATYEIRKDETLLSEKINSTTMKAKLVATSVVDLDLDKNEISAQPWNSQDEVYDTAETFELAEEIENVEALLGEEVTMWLNDDDEVFFMESKTASKNIVKGVVDEIDADEMTVVLADDSDDDYEFADTVKVYVNYKDDGYDETNLEAGMYVKAILEDGEVATVVAADWSIGIVDSVDAEDEEIDFKDVVDSDFEDNNGDLNLEDMEYDLDLEDLEEDMLVYWYSVLVDDKDDVYKFFFEVYEGSEVGELEEYKSGDYVVVGGEKYDLAYTLAGDYDFADITDLLGDEVEVFFGKDGKVAVIELDTAADEEKDYALVVDATLDTDKYGVETAYVKLLTAGGEVVEYEVSDEAILTEGAVEVDRDDDDAVDDSVDNQLTFGTGPSITIVENIKEFGEGLDNADANTLVKYALDKDGNIDELEVVGTQGSNVFDKDRERLGTGLFFEDDTLIFDAYNEEVISISMLDDNATYVYKYVHDNADLDVIVIYSDNYVEDTEYAIYLGKSNIADGEYKVQVMINGEVEYFNTDDCASDFDDAVKGQVYSLDITGGKISDASVVQSGTDTFIDEVVSVSTSKNRVEFDSEGFYLFADDVQVYEYTLKDNGTVNTVKAGAVRDLDDEQLVNVILDNDGYAEYIFIIDDDVADDTDVIEDIKF